MDKSPRRSTLGTLSLSMLLSSLGTSIANVALPTLTRAFDAPFQHVQWIVLAYLLATTTLIVSAGRLGDLVGRRRLLLGGILTFTIGSVFGAIAPSLWWLIGARLAQGAGAAVMMALAIALVGDTVPRSETGRALGLLGTMSAIGTALGPSVGGMLIAASGWRAIFVVTALAGALALIVSHRVLPVDDEPRIDRLSFDSLGTVLLVAALAAYALAVTTGRGHFGAANVALFALAAAGGAAFVLAEMKVASPLIQLELFRSVTMSASLAMSMLVATVMMATLVVGPFYLSQGLGLNSAAVGFALSLGPIITAVTGIPAGRLTDQVGTERLTSIGLGVMAVGALALFATPLAFGVPGYLAAIAVLTAGYALFQTANNTAVMAGVHARQRGVVSGMLSLSRNLGLLSGASAMGAVFAVGSASANAAARPHMAAERGMHMTFAVALVLLLLALGIAAWTRAPKTIGPLQVMRR